jgi:hypothetical protein
MYFSEAWDERLAVLARGTSVTVVGRIRNVEGAALHVERRELE